MDQTEALCKFFGSLKMIKDKKHVKMVWDYSLDKMRPESEMTKEEIEKSKQDNLNFKKSI